MLVVPLRRGGRRDHQRRVRVGTRQRFGLQVTGLAVREQRNTGQFVVRQIFDAARIAGHAQQIGVMDHDHLTVERKLHVEFDAIASLAGGGECGQRVFRSDRTGHIRTAVAGLDSHATGKRHIIIVFGDGSLSGIGLGADRIIPTIISDIGIADQTRTRIVQATMGIPYLRNGGHEITTLVIERARGHGPHGSTGGGHACQRHVSPELRRHWNPSCWAASSLTLLPAIVEWLDRPVSARGPGGWHAAAPS